MLSSVLIADDHPLIRTGLVHLLSHQYSGIDIKAVNNGEQALRALAAGNIELAILDISMPDCDGLTLVKYITEKKFKTISIVLTFHDDQAFIDRAFEYGASGYLLKEDAEENIIECISTVNMGHRYMSRSLVTQAAIDSRVLDLGRQQLTPSEIRILDFVASYMTSKEISKALSINIRTVQNHRANIVRKLNLSGTNALLKYAIGFKQQQG